MRANPLTTDANYTVLLSFESDIAQVVGLNVLFVESAGSLAELGAFAASRTIAPSLLAILDDFYYAQSSFVRNGPVKHLEIHQGEESILVLERDEIGISATGDIANINAVKFEASIKPAIERRLRRRSAFEKLNVESKGHAILNTRITCFFWNRESPPVEVHLLLRIARVDKKSTQGKHYILRGNCGRTRLGF